MLQFDEHIFSDRWQKNTNELYTAPIHFCVQELQRKISIQEAAAVKKGKLRLNVRQKFGRQGSWFLFEIHAAVNSGTATQKIGTNFDDNLPQTNDFMMMILCFRLC